MIKILNEEESNNPNALLCDVAKLMFDNKIKLVKRKISQLADRHEYYMGISAGDGGSRATEIIEEQQSKLFELLDNMSLIK